MLSNLPFSFFTLIFILSKSVWVLGLAFTNAAYDGIATGTPFEIEWSGDGTVSWPSFFLLPFFERGRIRMRDWRKERWRGRKGKNKTGFPVKGHHQFCGGGLHSFIMYGQQTGSANLYLQPATILLLTGPSDDLQTVATVVGEGFPSDTFFLPLPLCLLPKRIHQRSR